MAKKMYKEPVRRRLKREIGAIKRDRLLYIMVIPGVIFFLLFRYVPMYGITIAFRDYNLFRGFSDAPFIGMKIFNRMFNTVAFNRAFVNTIIISLSKLAWGFPAPIILSLMLNEVGHMKLKKAVQTSLLLPHFMSWVVIGGVLYMILFTSTGAFSGFTRTGPVNGWSVSRPTWCCKTSARTVRTCSAGTEPSD